MTTMASGFRASADRIVAAAPKKSRAHGYADVGTFIAAMRDAGVADFDILAELRDLNILITERTLRRWAGGES